ncbi:GNAT family N-acetyltransferase [Zoogloea sp.]|uniref:GNAT family N-acetyltransferase n=1 Tax=Zoogloea sp. TaxID=49181 RepID=UPI001416D70B|nr:MAG: GNAT family N-acetyltransferase [Zoogloea sp.]
MLTLRNALPTDLPAIMDIQARCYSAIVPETQASMGAKLAASPGTCFVAEHQGKIHAYLLALPWHFASPPGLDAPECRLPATPDTLYLHDLAVAPEARGSRTAGALVHAFLGALAALRLPRASLIAIQSSSTWWARHGFEPVAVDADLAARLASYGQDACYMALSAAAVDLPA